MRRVAGGRVRPPDREPPQPAATFHSGHGARAQGGAVCDPGSHSVSIAGDLDRTGPCLERKRATVPVPWATSRRAPPSLGPWAWLPWRPLSRLFSAPPGYPLLDLSRGRSVTGALMLDIYPLARGRSHGTTPVLTNWPSEQETRPETNRTIHPGLGIRDLNC